MNKYDLFLKQKNYDNEIIKNSKLKIVDVYPKKDEWVFFIEFNDFIDADLLFSFSKTVKEYFNNAAVKKIDIKVVHNNKNNFSKYALNYWDSSIHYLCNIKPSFSALENYNVTYEENKFLVHIDKDSVWVKEYFNEIYNVFRDIKIESKIECFIDENLSTIKQKIDERIETRTERLNENNYVPSKREVKETKVLNRNQKAQKVRINTIPMDQFGIDKYKNQNGNTRFVIEGEIVEVEVKELRTIKLLEMTIADQNDAITIKNFINNDRDFEFGKSLKAGMFVEVEGEAQFDTYVHEVVIMGRKISIIEGIEKQNRLDKSKEKRVELHLHTKMSDMDGVTEVKDYVDRALEWGHEAIAFTDHNGVYAFPDILKATKGKPIKPIYGVELDMVDTEKFVVVSNGEESRNLLEETYIVFDLETTGLSTTNDLIIEIGAVKVKNTEIIDRYQTFVNPNMLLSEFTKGLTNITDEDVVNARQIEDVLPEFISFIEDGILVAHNAAFDIKFITEKAMRMGLKIDNTYIDTLNLARYFYNKDLKRFNLKALSRFFKVELENHHRADQDAEATSKVWIQMLYNLRDWGIKTTTDLYNSIDKNESYKHLIPSHITALAKNQTGYKNIFKIVSKALTKNFYNGPRTIKEELNDLREGVLIGSACDFGDVFEAALNGRDIELDKAISFYDYIEVQPPSSYMHLMENNSNDGKVIIEATITKIIKSAKRQNKIVVATGNVHYLDDEDELYRKIYVRTPVVGGGLHPLHGAEKLPKQYFKTTNEMLEEFSFLDLDLAKEIVITNTNLINKQIESIKAFPDELYSLPDDAFTGIGVESIEKETKRLVYETAHKQYGEKLHPIVEARIEKELDSIIGNKFAPIYYISHLLVKKSLDDGYLVGSRGSVGSSFVATLMSITEVNPLKPHYRCKNGDFTVFNLTKEELFTYGISEKEKEFQKYFENVQSGFDLPDQVCPICGEKLIKDGHDIPFETFLGFKGDKVPDIDLNFSGDYQSKAHSYVRELLGEDYSFRAGTIGTVADKTAYGYVLGYLEDNNIMLRKAQIKRLADKIKGVKRSTGQHPGGIVVVPKNKEIFDVTPIQYPANDTSSDWYTTHFDYHSFESNLLKLDILGHDDPTMIKFLMDYVKEHQDDFPFSDARDIPLDDKEVLRMFQETKILGLKTDDIMSEVASFGIPEFGTPFTREMLNDTKPNSFAGLVKISGLSHGTDVWLKNAKDLIAGTTEYEKISFDDIIACRDDIMVQLSDMGLEPLKAFEIMEFVRKGKPSKDTKKWNTYVEEMEKHDVPKWYIWSASQIKYMFPKAHATAYVIMAIRIAWFKFYKPLLFYSAFFSKRAVQFDYEAMVSGANAIRNRINQLEQIPMYQRKVKDNDLLVTLGVALEMTRRGFRFLPVDIDKSEATTFVIEEKGIRMPFVSVDGLGEQVAYGIVEARNEKPFNSVSDVHKRTKINKTVQVLLKDYGAYGELNTENDVIDIGLFAEI
ncbi:PolC-type DNA polymerase III [Haploplasma axanthum]|uniref:DNA polymerase III PolC-type n=1 Tax=Haploplasma axanthum TaxID=29552 RepID=A0A449BCX0_HAPAX|nr:PolC-type DNA polymerase III [Haploplasma axanthum]VEU80275.1 DNA polymerase III polC-type [Haploplasma axanthum]